MIGKEGNRADKPESLPASFEHYWQYAKLWRTWVVGIAAAALFILLNKDIGGRFDSRATIAVLLIVAAGIQVLLAWINKTSAYYEYRQAKLRQPGSEANLSCWTRFWCWLGDKYGIDFVLDLASLILVGIAVYVMVKDMLSE